MFFGLERTLLRGRLGPALKECRKHFIAAAAFSALANVLYLAPTLYMIQVYDRAIPTGGVVTLAGLTIVVVASLAVLAAMEWMRSRVLVRAGARLDRLLGGPVLSALLASPSLKPEARTQAMREFDLFRQVLAGPGLLAALDVPWAPIYVIAASLLSPLLGLAGLASALLLLGLAWLNESATRRPLQQANEAAAIAYAAQDYVSASAGAVRALGMREALVQKQIADRRQMTDLQVQASMSAGAYASGLKGVRLVLQSGALGLAAYLAIKGQISAGAIFAASFLLTRTLAPVEMIVGSWKSIVLARSAHRKLNELLEAGETGHAQTLLPAPAGHLKIENLSVRAAADRPPILDNVSFEAGPGELVGVVGPSGAGKSTLMRIIAGAARADAGGVRIDGASRNDWDPERLARHIGYVPQDFALFPGTVKDNIARFRTYLGEDRETIDAMAVRAAQAIDAHEMILRLPQGYDTPIAIGGAGLSVGQAQRIAIARALFGDPKILVLDEPNANLDAEGEAALAKALAERREAGAAIVMVAHRSRILAEASRVIVMRGGRILPFDSLAEAAERMRRITAEPQESAPAELRMRA